MELKSGKSLWSYGGWQCRIPVPNVTEIGDGRLFITGGYGAGSAMIKVEKEGDTFAVSGNHHQLVITTDVYDFWGDVAWVTRQRG